MADQESEIELSSGRFAFSVAFLLIFTIAICMVWLRADHVGSSDWWLLALFSLTLIIVSYYSMRRCCRVWYHPDYVLIRRPYFFNEECVRYENISEVNYSMYGGWMITIYYEDSHNLRCKAKFSPKLTGNFFLDLHPDIQLLVKAVSKSRKVRAGN